MEINEHEEEKLEELKEPKKEKKIAIRIQELPKLEVSDLLIGMSFDTFEK